MNADRGIAFSAGTTIGERERERRRGCLELETADFQPGDLDAFVPVLDRIVVGSELPSGTS